jgi:hypothetical protein
MLKIRLLQLPWNSQHSVSDMLNALEQLLICFKYLDQCNSSYHQCQMARCEIQPIWHYGSLKSKHRQMHLFYRIRQMITVLIINNLVTIISYTIREETIILTD